MGTWSTISKPSSTYTYLGKPGDGGVLTDPSQDGAYTEVGTDGAYTYGGWSLIDKPAASVPARGAKTSTLYRGAYTSPGTRGAYTSESSGWSIVVVT